MAPRRLPNLERLWPSVPRQESAIMSKVPFCCEALGHCGSGKTYTSVALIKMLREEGSINRVFCLTPTATSNDLLNAICPDPTRDWKIDLDGKCFENLARIEGACEADAKVYREQLEYVITRDKFMRGDPISHADELLLDKHGWKEIKPVRPSPLLFLDDCQGSLLFSLSQRNNFNALVLRHRHVGSGLGISCLVAAQSSKGVPKPVRLQLTHMMLWKTHNVKERQSIYEETCAAFLSEPEFNRLFDMYTSRSPHSYMFVDLGRQAVSDSF